jgi:hypothetical protein
MTVYLDRPVAVVGNAKLDSSPAFINHDALLSGDDGPGDFVACEVGSIRRWEGIIRGNGQERSVEGGFKIPGFCAYRVVDSDEENAIPYISAGKDPSKWHTHLGRSLPPESRERD